MLDLLHYSHLVLGGLVDLIKFYLFEKKFSFYIHFKIS